MEQNISNHDRILHFLFIRGEEVTIEEIGEDTGLEKTQIYRAIQGLHERRLIVKDRKKIKAGYKTPPFGEVKIKLYDKSINFVEKILNKKELL